MDSIEDQLELLMKAGSHLIELVSHERARIEGFLVEVADQLHLPLYRWDRIFRVIIMEFR